MELDFKYAGHGLDLAWSRLPDVLKSADVGARGSGHVVTHSRFDLPSAFRFATSGFLASYVRSAAPFTIRLGSVTKEGCGEALVVVGSDTTVQAEFTGPVEGEFVSMSPELIVEALGRSDARIVSAIYGRNDGTPVRDLFSTLHACLTQTEDVDPYAYEALLHALLRLLVGPDAAVSKYASKLSVEQACTIRAMIVDRIADTLNVGDLAGAVNLSTGHFTRMFKASFGASPYQYVLRERVSVAGNLIREETHSLESVAKSSGFSNVAQMTRALKAYAGETARAMRAKRAFAKGMQPIDLTKVIGVEAIDGERTDLQFTPL